MEMICMALVTLAFLCLGADSTPMMQLSRAHKKGGAMPNTCGSWNYGTAGRAGESVNPFCKSTERDAGTTGLLHALTLPTQARAFSQAISFSESSTACSGSNCAAPSAYSMTTTYWDDRPCRSGEMFSRCSSLPVAARSSVAVCDEQFTMNFDTGASTIDSQGAFKKYTSPFPGAPACLLTCCETACPKTACSVDSHDKCPAASTFDCPQWPQCIVNDNCDSSNPTCTGLAGEIKGDSCAFQYPGCGAVNSYPGLKYNGMDARNTMTIVASGSAVDITDDTAQVSAQSRINKMCGASNNMFSYKASGSAALLGSAAVFPDKTSRRRNTNDATPEPNPANWECTSGHPVWCECSKMAKLEITSLTLTIKDPTILALFNRECSVLCTAGTTVALNQMFVLKSPLCNAVQCKFLSRIGYDAAPSASNTKDYYFQYYRPVEVENILYLGAQSTTLAGALELSVHAEGVYSLIKPCTGGCSLTSPSLMLSMILMIVGLFMPRY